MKKITMGLLLLLSITLSGCSFFNPYAGEVTFLKKSEVKSYKYESTVIGDLKIDKNEYDEYKVLTDELTHYYYESDDIIYGVYPLQRTGHVALEEPFINVIFEFNAYGYLLDFFDDNYTDLKQVRSTNEYKYENTNIRVNVFVNQDLNVIEAKIFDKEEDEYIFKISDINHTLFTIPEATEKTIPEFVMDSYSDVSYTFTDNIVVITVDGYNLSYSYNNGSCFVYNDTDIWTYVYPSNNFLKGDVTLEITDLLQSEPTLTSATLAKLLDIRDALVNYRQYFE